jgi:hypothetical protein
MFHCKSHTPTVFCYKKHSNLYMFNQFYSFFKSFGATNVNLIDATIFCEYNLHNVVKNVD